jgi:hypothetical protein
MKPRATAKLASFWAPGSRKRRLVLAVAVYLGCTIVYFACAPRELLTEHTKFNHFALLADSWLHGRFDLGHPPPAYTQNNDFAEYKGRWFVSFPPFPALILLPLVKLAGSPENLRDGQVWLWLAGVGPAILFLILEKLRRIGESDYLEWQNLILSAVFAFGTVYFFTAEQGTVWFAAHVVAVVLGGIYLLCALDGSHPVVAGTAVACLFATRPPMLLAGLFFVLVAARQAWRRDLRRVDFRVVLRKLVPFTIPLVAVVAITLWHNRARFGGGFLEFGHEHLTVGWKGRIEKWGLFSYHYLARNLGIVTSSLPYYNHAPPRLQINTHGLALWVTTPLYLWLLWPRRKSFMWRALLFSVLPAILAYLLYQNSGWLQFGYRFSDDYAVFLFALFAMGGYRFGALFYFCAAWSIAVNAFGALTFDRRGREHFYYTDGSQQIIFQPD